MGIWVWSDVLKQTYRGQHINVLITDTEGLASDKSNKNHDFRIFTLALLCCSTLIYNSQKVIDSDALDKLQLVLEMGKKLKGI